MPLIDNYLLDNYRMDGASSNKPLELITSGTVTSSSSSQVSITFDKQSSGPNFYYVNVGYSVPEVPKIITLKTTGGGITDSTFIRDIKNSFGNSCCFCTGSGGLFVAVGPSPFYVTTTSIRLPVAISGTSYTWEAWG